MTEQQKLRELLENSSHIVFFGGAGVSTESGAVSYTHLTLPTIRLV